jgi:RHS repeat-associated protein
VSQGKVHELRANSRSANHDSGCTHCREATTQFAYNGDGVRAGKTIGGATSDYLVDLAATLPVVITDTDAVYLYGLDIIAEQLAGAERYYYVHDGLGSVRQLVDSAGQIESRYAYDPFGVPLEGTGVQNPWQFTGEAWDAEVELLYLRARYYQPGTGRFMTKDPWPGDVSNPGTLHGYTYVLNSPVNYADPSGLDFTGPGPACRECQELMHRYTLADLMADLSGPSAPGRGPLVTDRGQLPYPIVDAPLELAPETVEFILIGWVPHEVLLGHEPDPYVVYHEMMSYAKHGYSRRGSVSLSELLLLTWFFPIGPEEWSFGPTYSLTKDVMNDPAIQWFKDEWRRAGHPLPFSRPHEADPRGGTWAEQAIGWAMLMRENYELGMCVLGRGSETAGGRIDPVGGVLGSLDLIEVDGAGVGVVKFEVHNTMDRASGSRKPGTDEPQWERVRRSEVNWLTGDWWGTTVYHHFYWYERDPLGVR